MQLATQAWIFPIRWHIMFHSVKTDCSTSYPEYSYCGPIQFCMIVALSHQFDLPNNKCCFQLVWHWALAHCFWIRRPSLRRISFQGWSPGTRITTDLRFAATRAKQKQGLLKTQQPLWFVIVSGQQMLIRHYGRNGAKPMFGNSGSAAARML